METTQLITSQNQIIDNKECIIDIVVKELQDVKRKITSIENNTILEELHLPKEDLEALGIVTNDKKFRKCENVRPLTEVEIKEAQEHYSNATNCAKYLNVGYNCYKKWAKIYGIFKTNPWGKGDKKQYWDPDKGKYPLNQILEGKFPNYPIYRLKDLIIKSGIKKAECERCGLNEHRITDGKMPLLIGFKDGNERNHLLENIEIICYNCTFLSGKGYVKKGKVEFNFIDPNEIQSSFRKIEARY